METGPHFFHIRPPRSGFPGHAPNNPRPSLMNAPTLLRSARQWAAPLVIALSATGVWAQGQSQDGPPGGGGGRPPAEALAACKSAQSGASCTFSGQRGTETGTCGGPEGKPLACMPASKSR